MTRVFAPTGDDEPDDEPNKYKNKPRDSQASKYKLIFKITCLSLIFQVAQFHVRRSSAMNSIINNLQVIDTPKVRRQSPQDSSGSFEIPDE